MTTRFIDEYQGANGKAGIWLNIRQNNYEIVFTNKSGGPHSNHVTDTESEARELAQQLVGPEFNWLKGE